MIGKTVSRFRALGKLERGGMRALRLKREGGWRIVLAIVKVEKRNTG